MAELVAVVSTVLNSPSVKALLAVIAATSAASPLLKFFHDRSERQLREREVVAHERIAEALSLRRKP